jgi:rod shape-determining protein MreD
VTLRVLLVVLVCLVLSVVESVVPFLAHLRAARPDLLLSVVIYIALNDEIVQGAALSAMAGYVSDLTSTTPPFLYTFLAVLTFLVLRIAGSALRTEGGVQSAAVAFGASLVHSLTATLVFGFFTGAGFHLQVSQLLWSALGTAIAAPFVFSILRRLDARFLHGGEHGHHVGALR